MGVVLMSKRELNRIDVLARLDGRRLTASAAADLMRITLRQTHRLLKRYRDDGAAAIANWRRGRPSDNRLSDVVRDHAIALVREHYADFGPTLAAEKLGERHDVRHAACPPSPTRRCRGGSVMLPQPCRASPSGAPQNPRTAG